jgi:hypothetical protein
MQKRAPRDFLNGILPNSVKILLKKQDNAHLTHPHNDSKQITRDIGILKDIN